MIKSMSARIAMAAVIWVTCLFSVNSVLGQSHSLKVTIPFDFYVGEKLLPAGDYEAMSFDNAVRFYSTATHASAGVQTQPLKKVSAVLNSPELVFNRYGEDYFLTEMWWGHGTSVGSMPMTSKREIELAKLSRPIRIEAKARP